MNNLWTPNQLEQLSAIEDQLVEAGVPEHQARMQAETEFEHRIDRRDEQALLSSDEL